MHDNCRRVMEGIKSFWSEHINFLVLHYFYIICLCFIFAGLYYCQPGTDWDFIDALYMSTTGATNTGLNTIAMSELSLYQYLLMFFSSICGSHVIVSIIIVLVRKHYFSKRFEDVLAYNRELQERVKQRKREGDTRKKPPFWRSKSMSDCREPNSGPLQIVLRRFRTENSKDDSAYGEEEIAQRMKQLQQQQQQSTASLAAAAQSQPTVSPQHEGAPGGIAFNPDIAYQRERARQLMDDTRDGGIKDKDEDDLFTEEINEILRKPIDKSQLTREQRYKIGGLEYRAIDFLSKMIPIWYLSVNLLGSLSLRIYIASSKYAQQVLETSNPKPMDPWLFSFFVCISSFDNLGLSVLDASMVPFLNAPAPLLITAFMILLGNTGYPISLRAAVWCMHKLTRNEHTRKTLRYLLDHPRRCYTNMFPSTQTWWLVIVVVVFNVVMTGVFLATNFWLPVLDGVSWPSRVLDGFFQGVSTRNAGFVVVNLLQVNPGTQICYIIFMYISVYPLAISIRNSNVYQERELGIYSHTRLDDEEQGLGPFKLRRKPTISSVMTSSRKLITKRPSFYVMQQLQRQLAQEIIWLVMGVFFICVIEAESIMSPTPITALTVLYECASAFGTAGSSTGFPGVSTSQSAQYHTLSKLILIALMVRGRHRGLPSAIDRAVQLPSEELDEMDNKEQQLKQQYHVDITSSRELSTSDPSMSTSRWHIRTSNSHRSLL